MSGYDQLSRAAYRAVDLEANERLVMAHIEQHFRGEFTRAELAKSMGWAINRITGRVVSLRDKGLLTEDKSRTVKCKVTHGDAHPLKNTTPPGSSNESADVFNFLVAVVPESVAAREYRSDALRQEGAYVMPATAAPHNYFSTTGDSDERNEYCNTGSDGSAIGGRNVGQQSGRRNGAPEHRHQDCEPQANDSGLGGNKGRARPADGYADRPVTQGDERRNLLIAVVPCIGYVEQMSIETAKRIVKEPANAFYDAAVARVKGFKSV